MSHIWVILWTKIDFFILDFQIFDDVIASLGNKKWKFRLHRNPENVLKYPLKKFEMRRLCVGALKNCETLTTFSTFDKSFDTLDDKFSRNEDMTLTIIFDVLSDKTKNFEISIFQISSN